MSLRLFVTGARADHRLLARKHVEIEWPDASIVEHDPGGEPPLDPHFTAAGFDALVLISAAPVETAESMAAEFLARPEFAPVVLVLLTEPPLPPRAPIPGLHRLWGRKIDHRGFTDALVKAADERRRTLALLRGRPDHEQRYRFGTVFIRGHRCIKQVGSGGMCTIYLAESERAGSVVVLKVFNQVPDVSERLVSFDRFLQEYEIIAGLNHPNIVRIHDLGVADDHAYIAMEHFPAGDLRKRLKSPLPESEAVAYVKQIAGALDAIHAVGVLHRDLKPANMMLRADRSLCLIDFGLAKANGVEIDLTGKREIFGTPYYMSPEQGHAETIDERSDLYSLGVVFFEMLMGRKPYLGASAMEVIYKHKRAELPPVDPKHERFAGILHRLLAKSPNDRFQSARELLDALEAVEVSA
jgi:hypothetical protein